jgi:hypothetical protein
MQTWRMRLTGTQAGTCIGTGTVAGTGIQYLYSKRTVSEELEDAPVFRSLSQTALLGTVGYEQLLAQA